MVKKKGLSSLLTRTEKISKLRDHLTLKDIQTCCQQLRSIWQTYHHGENKEKRKFKRSLKHTSNGSHEEVDNDKKQNKGSRQSFSGLIYKRRRGFMTRELSIKKTTCRLHVGKQMKRYHVTKCNQ